MPDSSKTRIARSFGAAAPTYDRSAQMQRKAVDLLFPILKGANLAEDATVLEIGCGTGLLSSRICDELIAPGMHVTITDIAEQMVEATKQRIGERANVTFRTLDGEAPEIEQKFDLITSSMTFQWFQDLPLAAGRLRRLLNPGGKLVFLTLGRDSFSEWRAVHDQVGVACATPLYPTLADLPGRVTETHIQAVYPHGMAFLRALRDIGAHISRDGQPPHNPALLRALIGALDKASGPKVTMTYHLLICELDAREAA